MRFKLINTEPKVFVVVFEEADDVLEGLERFCKEADINTASFTAIGAFSNAQIGYFELAAKYCKNIPVNGQVEVLSFIGNIVPYENKPKVHGHVVLGKSDGSTCGGHLLSAIVNPTLEVVVTAFLSHLHREMNDHFGIPLINL